MRKGGQNDRLKVIVALRFFSHAVVEPLENDLISVRSVCFKAGSVAALTDKPENMISVVTPSDVPFRKEKHVTFSEFRIPDRISLPEGSAGRIPDRWNPTSFSLRIPGRI